MVATALCAAFPGRVSVRSAACSHSHSLDLAGAGEVSLYALGVGEGECLRGQAQDISISYLLQT